MPAPAQRRGARLGVDVGDVRIGVAVSDADALVAAPVETVRAGPRSHARLVELAREREVVEVIVGLPRSMSGGEGPAARKVRAYAVTLSRLLGGVPVRLVDERLSTVTAERTLRERGRRGARRRAVVDQVAAVVILQSSLDTERTSGSPPGETVPLDGTADSDHDDPDDPDDRDDYPDGPDGGPDRPDPTEQEPA